MNRPSRGVGRTPAQSLRRTIAQRLRGHEDGITLAIFAIALLVLLAMVALGIDGSRIYDERRKAQNAADHAAIAAAFASCTSTSTDLAELEAAARTAGLASAASNGYDNGATNDVEIDVRVGATADQHQYTATIETTIPTTFAKVIGFASLDTHGEATAEATGCDETASSLGAIHAGGTSCPGGTLRTIEFNGNDNVINGKTTAYGGMRLSGNFNTFTNTPPEPSVEYGGTFSQSGSGNVYSPPRQAVTVPSAEADRWPAGWAPSDQTAAMWSAYSAARTNGSATTDKFEIFTNGIYYTDRVGGVVVEIKSSAVNSITVVNRSGPIMIGEFLGGRTFTAYPAPSGTPANAMFVTGYNGGGQPCDQDAIRRSGEGGTWNGVWWAPRGRIIFSGNLNTVNGGLVAHAVHWVGGNNNTINGGTGAAAEEPDVLLLE